MSTTYLALITGAGNAASGTVAAPIPNGQAGDKVLNIIVLSGGTFTPGLDVTNDFQQFVGVIPSLTNVNFSGPYLVHQGVRDFSTSTLLALMSRG